MEAKGVCASFIVTADNKDRMSTISPHVRGKSWVFQVTALCIVLGMLLALSLKTQRQVVKEGGPNRLPALQAAFRLTKQDNIKLQKELADYKSRYEKIQTSGVRGSDGIQRTLAEAQMLAGTVAVHGPGVIVILRDSPKRVLAETREEEISQYIVHDYDIRAIVNELFASGAEAASVNGQRLVANSSIRCVGPVVLVNTVQVAAPFEIKAIGNSRTLKDGLALPGGDTEGLFLLDMIEVKEQANITVPAYTGSTRYRSAQPAEKKGGR